MRSNSFRSLNRIASSFSSIPSNDHNHNHRQAISQTDPQSVSNVISRSTQSLTFQQKVDLYALDPDLQKRKFCWPPNFYTKCRILAVKELYEQQLRDGHISDLRWTDWLPKMLSKAMPADIINDNGRYRFKKPSRLKDIKNNIKRWNRNAVKLNYVVNHKGLRGSGAGRKDDFPADVQLATYKMISDIADDPDQELYKDDIADMLESQCASYGIKVFHTKRELQQYRQSKEDIGTETNGISSWTLYLIVCVDICVLQFAVFILCGNPGQK